MWDNGRFRMPGVKGRRDRHDIVAEILETARGGAIKTHIMYKAKLSYNQLNDYLTSLVESGLLENHTIIRNRKIKQFFKTSELGVTFIRNFRTLELLDTCLSRKRLE